MIRSAPKAALQALPVDVEDTKMYLILDTGCQRTVAGTDWLKQARQELLKRFSLNVTFSPRVASFSSGPEAPRCLSNVLLCRWASQVAIFS
jgi:hypothetical protein